MREEKHAATLVIAAAIGLLSACTTFSHGNSQLANTSRQQVSKKLIAGHTTEADVRRLFGDPNRVRFLPKGGEEWRYSYSESQQDPKNFIPFYSMFHTSVNTDRASLTLRFNENRILKKYRFINPNSKMSRDVGT